LLLAGDDILCGEPKGMSILTPEQHHQFVEEGYVLVSGLIADDISQRGAAALWRRLNANPDDPTTWGNVPLASGHNDPDIIACFTPEAMQVASELAGEAVNPVTGTLTLNIFPQEGAWSHHGPHIDHALPRDGFKVFPRPMRVASITYLNDVPRHGAGTVVWPGSFRKIEALAQSDPQKYELMATLNNDLGKIDLGEPVELLGKRGDVLFYHYLTAHSGSRNATQTPRLALVHKW
jgi:hypothetical protein